MVEEKMEVNSKTKEELAQARIVVEESPIEEGNPVFQEAAAQDQQNDVSSMSFNEYCNKSREMYEKNGVKTDDWREHRQFLYISKLLGLSINKMQSFDLPNFDFKQKEIIVFLIVQI